MTDITKLLVELYTKANEVGGAEEVALASMAVDVYTQKFANGGTLKVLKLQIQDLIESYA